MLFHLHRNSVAIKSSHKQINSRHPWSRPEALAGGSAPTNSNSWPCTHHLILIGTPRLHTRVWFWWKHLLLVGCCRRWMRSVLKGWEIWIFRSIGFVIIIISIPCGTSHTIHCHRLMLIYGKGNWALRLRIRDCSLISSSCSGHSGIVIVTGYYVCLLLQSKNDWLL